MLQRNLPYIHTIYKPVTPRELMSAVPLSLVYAIREVEHRSKRGPSYTVRELLPQASVAGAGRADIHVHSFASGYVIPYAATKWLGVRECYTPPESIRRWTIGHPLEGRRQTLWTFSDHDVIHAAEDMRERYPESFFTSCEYTASVRDGKAYLHVGVLGLEYAGGVCKPRSRKEVEELHEELTEVRLSDWRKLFEFCEKESLVYVTNHLFLVMESKRENWLTAEEIYEIGKASKFIEINGDCQIENIAAIEMARRLNKPVVAGSDAHTTRRLGYQYTETTVPVSTPAEYIQAFRDGNVAIGSKYPVHVEEPEAADIMRQAFDGSPFLLFQDSIWGTYGYLRHDYVPSGGLERVVSAVRKKGLKQTLQGNIGEGEEPRVEDALLRNTTVGRRFEAETEDRYFRKYLATTLFFGLSLGIGAGLGALLSPFWGAVGSAGVLTLLTSGIFGLAKAISNDGKKDFAYRARAVYRDLWHYLADEDTGAFVEHHGWLVQQAEKLESRVAGIENPELRTHLEELRQGLLDRSISFESAIEPVRDSYAQKRLRLPHTLVGLRTWLERLVHTDYSLAERDLSKLLEQRRVAGEKKEEEK